MSELAFDKEGDPFRSSRRTKELRPLRWKDAGQHGTCAAVLDVNGKRELYIASTHRCENGGSRAGVISVNRGPKIDRPFSPKGFLRRDSHVEALDRRGDAAAASVDSFCPQS